MSLEIAKKYDSTAAPEITAATLTAPDGRMASVTITIQVTSDSGTAKDSAIACTDDSSNIWIYISIAALAAAFAVGLVLAKKKRRVK